MIANRTTSFGSHVLPISVMLGLAWAFAVSGAESVPVRAPLVTTNTVLVTNSVTVTMTNLLVTANAVVATKGVAGSSLSSALPDLSWVPPEDRFDWIQLKSGEWLKGRIKAMQDRELEFDSEELDNLTFDWKDIRQVRSPRILDVLFSDGELVSGPVAITPSEVAVGEETPRVLPRDQLQSLTPGGSKERNYWSGNISAGLTLRSGNTEQVEYTAQAHLQRRTPATRLTLDYIGNVSRVDGTSSADNHRINAEFDRWLSRRFYLIVPFAEYYKDPFQNLDYRLTGGVGAGYDLIVEPSMEWTVTAGPAYQYSWFESSQPGEPTEKGAAALAFGTRFDWDITRKLELELSYRGQYTSRQVGETTHHAVGTLSIDITKRFELDVSLTWDRIARPKVGSDGVEPKPDDFRLVVGLGMDF